MKRGGKEEQWETVTRGKCLKGKSQMEGETWEIGKIRRQGKGGKDEKKGKVKQKEEEGQKGI